MPARCLAADQVGIDDTSAGAAVDEYVVVPNFTHFDQRNELGCGASQQIG